MFERLSYYALLLLIIIFCFYVLFINLKSTPKKIKPFISMFLGIGIFRNLFLLLLSMSGGSINLELSRVIACLDMVYIPAILLSIFYIYWRSDKNSYKSVIKYLLLFIGVFIVSIIIFRPRFEIGFYIGYNIGFINEVLYRWIQVGILVILTVCILWKGNNASTNIIGMRMLIAIIGVIVMENIILLYVDYYLPYCLISEFFVLLGLESSLKTFKS